MEENMSLISKSIENTNVQMEKQQLQQQVAIISFDGLALDWYRSQDERESFKSWDELK